MNIFKPLTVLLATIPLLGSCSLFQPSEKVIEYDEEVKLHDGSMIWVHIRRHYIEVGNLSQGSLQKSYLPGAVEISWDTGFPNVGRKSVFFQEQVSLINKYDNMWYVAGARNSSNSPQKIDDAINCNNFGKLVGDNGCIVSVDEKGNYLPANLDDFYNVNLMNVLYPVGASIALLKNQNRLTVSKKLEIESSQMKLYQDINQPYIKGQIK